MSSTDPILITHPTAIELFHLQAQKHALQLEIKGLRHSSGRSVSAHLKRTHGWKGNKPRILEQLEALIETKEAQLRDNPA